MKKLFIVLIGLAVVHCTSAQTWNLAGNSSTTSSHFIGTTDNLPLRFKTNNTLAMLLDENGNLTTYKDIKSKFLHFTERGTYAVLRNLTPSNGFEVMSSGNLMFLMQDGNRRVFFKTDGDVFLGGGSGEELSGIGTANGTNHLIFKTNGTASVAPAEKMRLSNNGNLLIGTTTDDGQRLRVTGDALIEGYSIASKTLSTSPAGYTGMLNGDMTINTTGFSLLHTGGVRGTIRFTGNNTYYAQSVAGITGVAELNNGAKYNYTHSNEMAAILAIPYVNNTGSYADRLNGVRIAPKIYNGGNVGWLTGLRIDPPDLSGGGTVSTYNAIYSSAGAGDVYVGDKLNLGTGSYNDAKLNLMPATGSMPGVRIQQNPGGQTANMFEIINPYGAAITKFDQGGRLIFNYSQGGYNPPFLMATANLSTVPNFADNIPMVFIQPGAVGQSGLIIKDLPSQLATSFLQEWQNSAGQTLARLSSDGSFGIGTNDTKGYRLAVNGDAIFTKVKVKTFGSWPDYVFEKEYALPSLEDVERFINEHKHLPGMPTAKEVGENGLDVGENQAALLKKIEELTLYVITQSKQIADLEQMKKDFDSLKLEVEKLKSQSK